jgi:hypothetical protein
MFQHPHRARLRQSATAAGRRHRPSVVIQTQSLCDYLANHAVEPLCYERMQAALEAVNVEYNRAIDDARHVLDYVKLPAL